MIIKFLKEHSERFFPGYFAFILATGALSLGLHFFEIDSLSRILLYINVIAYLILWTLNIIRSIYFKGKLLTHLTNPSQGAGFFTFVAGTGILGSEFILIEGDFVFAFYLWVLSFLLWMLIMYTFFTAVIIKANKPAFSEAINGSWLLSSVATQSISVLSALLSLKWNTELFLFISICMYLLGLMLYILIIILIFYRLVFKGLHYKAITPPYWINMGGAAIATLAGTTLVSYGDNWSLLSESTTILKAVSLLSWVTAIWWIPLLLILFIWRHLYHRDRLLYHPQNWSIVFPLSMFTIATIQLSSVLGFPFLMVIPKIMIYVSGGVWLIVFIGMLRNMYSNVSHALIWSKGKTDHE